MEQILNGVMSREDIVNYMEKFEKLTDKLKEAKAYTKELEQKVQEQQEELEKSEKLAAEYQKSFKKQAEETARIKENLKNSEELTDNYQEELQDKLEELEIEVEKKDEEIQNLVQKLKEKEIGEDTPRIPVAYDYSQEIQNILREARREGADIVNNARIEAEEEMVKVLNIRAKYRKEQELYKDWCSRVEKEKKSIEEFLSQLAAQYNHMNNALNTVRESASSFDIQEIYKAVDIQQDQVVKKEYEETAI